MTENNDIKKIIIAMNGNKDGKNAFINLTSDKYFVWHRNFYDILSKGNTWCQDKDSILYLRFLKEQKDLVNKYFDLELNYLYHNIHNFVKNVRAEILFLHAINRETVEILREDYEVITIHIRNADGKESLDGYDFVLEYPDDNFENLTNELLDKFFVNKTEEGVTE